MEEETPQPGSEQLGNRGSQKSSEFPAFGDIVGQGEAELSALENTHVPEMAPMADIHTAWISRDKLMQVYDRGVIQEELAKVRRALARRTEQPAR